VTILNWIFLPIITVIILISTICLRKMQYVVESKIDEDNITPSDFTVFATNIPLNKSEEDVKKFFSGIFPEFKVQNVNYCYNLTGIMALYRKENMVQGMLNYMESYKERKLKKMGITEEDAEAEELDMRPPGKKRYCFFRKPFPDASFLELALASIQKKIEAEKKHFDVTSEKDLFVGSAFITFND